MQRIVTAVRRRLGYRAKVLKLLAGIDLVTTGTAAAVLSVKATVTDILVAERTQTQLLADIQKDLDGLDIPAEQRAQILAAIQARIEKLRGATPPPTASPRG